MVRIRAQIVGTVCRGVASRCLCRAHGLDRLGGAQHWILRLRGDHSGLLSGGDGGRCGIDWSGKRGAAAERTRVRAVRCGQQGNRADADEQCGSMETSARESCRASGRRLRVIGSFGQWSCEGEERR